MRKQKRFLSALLLLALFVGLLPTFRVTADATFATQKNYTISGEDVFQYSYTPDTSGLYEVEVQGCDKGLNPRISFTDAEGNTPLRAGADDFYSSTKATIYYLEQGKTYTFTHSVIDEDLSCLLTISHYNATTLTLNKAASFRADPVAFFEFFPTEDGWYTFTGPKEDWNVVLDWIWVDGQSLLDGEPYVFSDGGVHLYFKGGSRVYFGIMGWTNHNGTMTVKKSTFPTLQEEGTVTLSINNTDTEVYALAYQYASFTAPYTGRYELNLSYSDMYDWTLSPAIYDPNGNEVTGEGFDRNRMLGYWDLAAGKTYAVGATGLSSSLNGRVTVQLTCVEWNAEPETPKLCEKHTYTSATGNTCTVCGYEFEPKLTAYSKTLYVAKGIVPVRDNYYSKSSTVVETLTKGTAVKVTHKLQNALGNEWYVTDSGKYIYAKNLTATAPNAHTLTFNANGGTGAPASITTVAAKYGIPSSKPKRNGYTFRGWSTNKKATTAEYQPGKSIALTSNITLYAVWEKLSVPSATETVDSAIQAVLDKTTGFPQVKQVYSDGSKGPGLCTSSATALMMKRKQIVDGFDGTFDFYDVRMSLGLSRSEAEALRGVDAYWTRAGGFSNLYSGNGNITYFTTGIKVSKIGNTIAQRKAKLISLLEKHPEGIVIYCKTADGKHAVLLTGYNASEDMFYACDSVDVRDATTQQGKCPEKITETYLYRACEKSVDTVINNLVDSGSAGCVWYISSATYR